ncbi:MAG: phosphatidylserine decarboxylase family protein [Thermodesulfobacteriota bacterium]
MAREGLPFIVPPLLVALAAALAQGWFIALPLGLLGLFSAWFFRDPDRFAPPGEHFALSPADGKVIKVEEVEEDRFLNRRVRRISIFMNLFDVHVNRAPLSGLVIQKEYHPGRFFSADLDKASRENEHNALILETGGGRKMVVVQIAGLVARRIACWVAPGDQVVRGQRFGLIRFGSRLDVYLPLEAEVEVRPGQRVRAGESVLAALPPE